MELAIQYHDRFIASSGTPIYVIMLRHPLQRLFSAFYQSRRDRHSLNHRKTLHQFVEDCAVFPGKGGGGGGGGAH